MKLTVTFFTCLIFCLNTVFGQAVFQSAATGNWNASTSWTLVSGTSATNYPVAGDEVTISTGHTITVNTNSQCGQLTINGASQLILNSNASILTVAGTVTENGASVVNLTQGVFTVIGVMLVTSPASAGSTLLNVQGGSFSCAGGMSITGTTSTRTAELRIGNSLVNIVGGLATITANAKINFNGNGSLTLAGIINISNPASFTAGSGRVIYVGIPGSDQFIAPLTYNRLVITGLGSGIKKINAAVVVTDTLVLLSDTLAVTGGSLTMNDACTIVRTAGKLITAPNFAGVIDIVYNNIIKDTTGAEVPTNAAALRSLTITNIAGVQLAADVTVNNSLHLLQGPLLTNGFNLTITNPNGGSVNDPAIERTNGYVSGSITRSIGASTGIRIFPFGTQAPQGYKEFLVNYTTAPSAAGALQVTYINSPAANQSGLPLQDGAISIVNVAPFYWQADALAGLAGGVYTLNLTSENTPGVTDISTLRIIKRSTNGGAWTLNGIAGTNTGTTSVPVVIRSGMSNFSQFAIGSNSLNVLPLSLLYFKGTLSQDKAFLQWATTSEINSYSFTIEKSNDGIHFSNIAIIMAAGNSSTQQQYSYADEAIQPGINYYRLKQTDIDGRFSESNIVSIKVDKWVTLNVYPTLSINTISIQSAQKISLYNSNGQFIKILKTGLNDISGLAAGKYYIINQGKRAVAFIKQ